jgi:anti-sigma factor RsiW
MNRQHGASHPDEAALVAWATGSDDPAIAAHLEACPACQRRIDDWRSVMSPIVDTLRATADERLTETFLTGQREEVMRRLRGEPRARVIRFPAPDQAERAAARVMRPEVRRWVAAAAVFGILVGGSVVRLLDPRPNRPLTSTAGRASTASSQPVVRPVAEGGADEAFLVELDTALYSRGPEPLRVLDAMTPERDPAGRPR